MIEVFSEVRRVLIAPAYPIFDEKRLYFSVEMDASGLVAPLKLHG
jgi:hypothetical protein